MENTKEVIFKSRITGKETIKTHEHKTIFELGKSESVLIPNLFLIDRDLEIEKEKENAYIALSAIWNYDEKFIISIADYFESTDESNYFLDIYDASDANLEEAWDTYCHRRDIYESNPFN